jgi:prenyl protein peptidase
MGYFPIGIEETVKTVGLTAILFIGPLFEACIVEGGWRDWICLRGLNAVYSGWIGYRNMVAVYIALPASVRTLLISHSRVQ